ncbi:MAG: VWA domain-containing protein, partial [Crenarchaeota archaeon]|nr:VWA domain-containing protein [Thermoproteota archaeon]
GTMYQYPLTTALNWLRTYRYFNVSAYVVFASDGLPADLPIAMDIVKQYAKLHIPIYTIFIGASSMGYRALEKIAKTTGGKCFQAANAAQILDKYIKAAEEVKSNIIRSVNVTVTEKIKVQQKYLLEPYLYAGGLTAYIAAILIAYMTRKITY